MNKSLEKKVNMMLSRKSRRRQMKLGTGIIAFVLSFIILYMNVFPAITLTEREESIAQEINYDFDTGESSPSEDVISDDEVTDGYNADSSDEEIIDSSQDEATEQIAEETTEETTEEATEQIAEETTEEVTEQVTEETTEQASEETSAEQTELTTSAGESGGGGGGAAAEKESEGITESLSEAASEASTEISTEASTEATSEGDIAGELIVLQDGMELQVPEPLDATQYVYQRVSLSSISDLDGTSI